jgi:hypothetical protein
MPAINGDKLAADLIIHIEDTANKKKVKRKITVLTHQIRLSISSRSIVKILEIS